MNFQKFIKQDAFESGYSLVLIKELEILYYLITNYNDYNKTDLEIINDPSWSVVVLQAQKVMCLFFKTNPINIQNVDELY